MYNTVIVSKLLIFQKDKIRASNIQHNLEHNLEIVSFASFLYRNWWPTIPKHNTVLMFVCLFWFYSHQRLSDQNALNYSINQIKCQSNLVTPYLLRKQWPHWWSLSVKYWWRPPLNSFLKWCRTCPWNTSIRPGGAALRRKHNKQPKHSLCLSVKGISFSGFLGSLH